MGDFDDMIPEYVTESTELLADVESGFLALEEGTADDETINTIFRAIHSIKGGAGFVGLSKIEHLAHKMEDLLGLIRNKDMAATPPVAVALLKALDVLRSLFDNIENMDSIDTQPAMDILRSVLEGGASGDTLQELDNISLTHEFSDLPHFEVSNYNLKNAFHQYNIFYLKLDLARVEQRGVSPMELFSEILSMGEVLDANLNLPPAGQDDENMPLSVDVLYATVLETDLLITALHLEEGEYRILDEKDFKDASEDNASEKQAAPLPAAAAPETPPARGPASPALKEAQAVRPSAPPPPRAAPEPAETPPAEPADKDYLTFRLGSEIFCVDILRVQEIIDLPHMAKLPRSRRDVLGVMNLRGMVVPVFDLRIRFDLPNDPNASSVVVVMRQNEKIMGGIVDEVHDVVHIKADMIQPPPIFVDGVNENNDARSLCLEGVSQLKDDIVILLNVDRVFAIGEVFL
ncbi:MAG: chemotaxis protein CheW [Desulfarculales bacterium]|jgi:chemotaxis signal transduction protein/HPt (histidine-containing phosphotransfer) domain-containing protein|nr:chemotaxis protein CheW [Desulfarculales bacterium]